MTCLSAADAGQSDPWHGRTATD